MYYIGNNSPSRCDIRTQAFSRRSQGRPTTFNKFYSKKTKRFYSFDRNEKEKDHHRRKKMKLRKNDAENFGRAFGTAWKAAH